MTKLSLTLLSLALALSGAISAQPLSKERATPAFYQRDKGAGFANQGREYCAPTSISNGLLYLAQARGMARLVDGSGHDAQVRLIKELASLMATDPKIGTSPDKILTGLRKYVAAKGFQFRTLELSSWRSVTKANKSFKVGSKPNLSWITRAVEDPDSVVVFNVGWYDWKDDQEVYFRKGGHWITVVGAGPAQSEFHVHNPSLTPQAQAEKISVKLKQVDKDFSVMGSNEEEKNMAGYYQVSGPGLPYNSEVRTAVLDSVIVFSLRH